MDFLNTVYIQNEIADSKAIFKRGTLIYDNGGYSCLEFNPDQGSFEYEVDGNYGDYQIEIEFEGDKVQTSCSCPYPGRGCKHTVAVLMDIENKIIELDQEAESQEIEEQFLTAEEIKTQALQDRVSRAKSEKYILKLGDMFKGEHIIETEKSRRYKVAMLNPQDSLAHCTCPDYLTNQMATCKHIIHLTELFREDSAFSKRIDAERFPFINIYWDSITNSPKLFNERPHEEIEDILEPLGEYFDSEGTYKKRLLTEIQYLFFKIYEDKRVKIENIVLDKLDEVLQEQNLLQLSQQPFPNTL